jgi:hypothetical protein
MVTPSVSPGTYEQAASPLPESISPAGGQSDRGSDTLHSLDNFRNAEGGPAARSCWLFRVGRRALYLVVLVVCQPASVVDPDSHFRDCDTPPPSASDRGFAFGLVVEKHDTGGASLSEAEVEEEGAAIAAL